MRSPEEATDIKDALLSWTQMPDTNIGTGKVSVDVQSQGALQPK